MQTTKAQISLRIRVGLSAPFLFAHVYCSQPVYVTEQPGLYLNWSDTLKIGYFMIEHGVCTDSLRNMTHASSRENLFLGSDQVGLEQDLAVTRYGRDILVLIQSR